MEIVRLLVWLKSNLSSETRDTEDFFTPRWLNASVNLVLGLGVVE